jgi:hypothetical protein
MPETLPPGGSLAAFGLSSGPSRPAFPTPAARWPTELSARSEPNHESGGGAGLAYVCL